MAHRSARVRVSFAGSALVVGVAVAACTGEPPLDELPPESSPFSQPDDEEVQPPYDDDPEIDAALAVDVIVERDRVSVSAFDLSLTCGYCTGRLPNVDECIGHGDIVDCVCEDAEDNAFDSSAPCLDEVALVVDDVERAVLPFSGVGATTFRSLDAHYVDPAIDALAVRLRGCGGEVEIPLAAFPTPAPAMVPVDDPLTAVAFEAPLALFSTTSAADWLGHNECLASPSSTFSLADLMLSPQMSQRTIAAVHEHPPFVSGTVSARRWHRDRMLTEIREPVLDDDGFFSVPAVVLLRTVLAATEDVYAWADGTLVVRPADGVARLVADVVPAWGNDAAPFAQIVVDVGPDEDTIELVASGTAGLPSARYVHRAPHEERGLARGVFAPLSVAWFEGAAAFAAVDDETDVRAIGFVLSATTTIAVVDE